jgi:uncharacterized membrane protein HdeD (DUF308 family)
MKKIIYLIVIITGILLLTHKIISVDIYQKTIGVILIIFGLVNLIHEIVKYVNKKRIN